MSRLLSYDGTVIAFDRNGVGPPLIVVAAGAADRRAYRGLKRLLASSFTVCTYDRRGRGDSGGTVLDPIERELDDLDAMIEVAGGTASVFAASDGGFLALEAAARGSSIVKMALWEPPYAVSWSARKALTRALGSTTAVRDLWSLTHRLGIVNVPALVLDGGTTQWIAEATGALVRALPIAERRTLHGQPHAVSPAAIAPVLAEYLAWEAETPTW